ncbi:copper homeostasis protein cutC homolog isoform X2 [Hemitrygon akajei]|uniref:copper homeostasis protein cutC homolog isoform X2 n=1 Tax=Hemitrygon akajei TaxID=2704970 RepID=UPI003BF9FE2C
MAPGILMEVCVDSVESAISAERGGASRIELCSSLVEGGVTPSIGLLQVVKQYVKIPVFAIVRPRGGDFLYTDSEIEVMKADIKMAKASGANGIVFGVLTEDGRVNCEVCLDLIAESRPLPVTFHRAFDMVHDPSTALECLISLGFDRVLTSGCDSTALEGLPTLKHLVEQAKQRIIVVAVGQAAAMRRETGQQNDLAINHSHHLLLLIMHQDTLISDQPLQPTGNLPIDNPLGEHTQLE